MRACSLLTIIGLIALPGCMLSGKAFVDRSRGYAVTRGGVVNIENLFTRRKDHLSDGVALRIADPGARVTMNLGGVTQVIDLTPGCILILGEKDDWLLDPYDALKAREAGQQAGQPASPAAGPGAAPAPGTGDAAGEMGPPLPRP